MPFVIVHSMRPVAERWSDAPADLAALVSDCLNTPTSEVQVIVHAPTVAVHGAATYVEVKCRQKPDRTPERLADAAARIKALVAEQLEGETVVRLFAHADATIGAA